MNHGTAPIHPGQRHDLALPGCTPEPLLAYLKGLGVLRLVAAQADRQARGYWRDDVFHLTSTLDAAQVERFFLEEYRPTPIISPWNSAGGFDGDDASVPGQAVGSIAASTDPRLEVYREAIAVAQEIVRDVQLRVPDEKERKPEILRRCRNNLPDEALSWLDAAVVLTGEKPRYPPLLGTGGNDGRLEFTVNYMQRLADLLPDALGGGVRKRKDPQRGPGPWLHAALLGDTNAVLIKAAVGQFNPGGAGGPNAAAGFTAESLVNPWDLVLALEGACFFATAATRRFTAEASAPMAAIPFTVAASAVGYASAGEDDAVKSRAELWLPLWTRPATAAEVNFLFAEGRASVGRRVAGSGVDFARAVAGLGVDRGVAAFTRFGLLQRSGKAYLAAPLGRLRVQETPVRGIHLLDQLDRSLDAWRRSARDNEGHYAAAVRGVDAAMFNLAQRSGAERDPRAMLAVLAAVGRAARTFAGLAVAQRRRGEEPCYRPLQGLSDEWLEACDDGSVELRLAAALAGIGGASGALRTNLEPVMSLRGRWGWAREVGPEIVWSTAAPLPANLERVLERRCMDAQRTTVEQEEGASGVAEEGRRSNHLVPMAGRWPASLADIGAFLAGTVDDDLLGDVTWGLCGVTVRGARSGLARGELTEGRASLPRAYALLKLLFSPRALRPRNGNIVVPYVAAILPLLRAARVADAMEMAARRLRASGLVPLSNEYAVSPVTSRRLTAALAFPITNHALDGCDHMVLRQPDRALA